MYISNRELRSYLGLFLGSFGNIEEFCSRRLDIDLKHECEFEVWNIIASEDLRLEIVEYDFALDMIKVE